MPSVGKIGSYRVDSFSTNVEAEIRRLNAQVDLFWENERALLAGYGLRGGMSLLDCGCGPGRLIELIKRDFPAVHCTGLEMDPILVDTANRMLSARGLGDCKVLQGTAEEPGLGEGTFDFIVLRLVLEHVPDPALALRNLAALLKPGGRFVVIDNDFDFHLRTFPPVPELEPLYAAYRASRRRDGGDPCIGRRLPQLLAQAGLVVSAFEIEVSHNAVVGDSPFLKSEGAGIPAKLVSSGFLDEAVLDALTRNWLAMLVTPGHAIMRQLFVAVGELSVDGAKRPLEPEGATADPGIASGAATSAASAGAASGMGGSLGLLLELLPVALEKGMVAPVDSLIDLGMDSLAAMSLQELVRERTGVEIPIARILKDVTVTGLAGWLDQALANREGHPLPGGRTGRVHPPRNVEEEL